MRKAISIGSLLQQVLDDQGMNDRLSRYQAWLIWDQVVGEQIARRARPLRFREGILEVRVDNPVWMQQLQMLKPKILQKLNDKLPNARIEDIYLRRGNHTPRAMAEPPPAVPPAWRQQELSSQDLEQVENSLRAVNDPELKEELRRLFSLQKRLEKARLNQPDES
ncbi:MAG: DUF721 domain-containing protein [Desulfuromonadales bacterium]|jgi:hypothetical protein|nr:DUF721 domain-containing protein [Desulfuromonadales bacterium]